MHSFNSNKIILPFKDRPKERPVRVYRFVFTTICAVGVCFVLMVSPVFWQ